MGKASPIDKAQEIILFLSISFLLEGSGDSIYFYPLKIKAATEEDTFSHFTSSPRNTEP